MKTLVIQTRDIGDVLLSTALCNSIRRVRPDSEVHMLTMDHCAGVVEGNPDVDRVLVLDGRRRNRVGYMFRFLRELRHERYDLVLNVQGQLIGLLSCLASGARARVGYDKLPWRLGHTDSIRLRDYEVTSGWGWTIDDRFALLERIGLAQGDRRYSIWLSPDERERGAALLREAGLDPERPTVALGINARDEYKLWPQEAYAEVAAWLIRERDAQVLVFFGPGEEAYSKALRGKLPAAERASLFDDVRTGSIRELAMVFTHCDLYLGNDTGPRHVAQAVDLPAFAIVSPSSDKWGWIPWDQPRFRAIDTGDALGMKVEEWQRLRAGLTPGGPEDAQWFSKITPDFVRQRVSEMLNELDLLQVQSVTGA